MGAQRTSLRRPYLHEGDKTVLFNTFFFSPSCSSAQQWRRAVLELTVNIYVHVKASFCRKQAGKQSVQMDNEEFVAC